MDCDLYSCSNSSLGTLFLWKGVQGDVFFTHRVSIYGLKLEA